MQQKLPDLSKHKFEYSPPSGGLPNVQMGPIGNPDDGCSGCKGLCCGGHGQILTLEVPFMRKEDRPKGW